MTGTALKKRLRAGMIDKNSGGTIKKEERESDELLLLEKWRDADAFEAHKRQAHFARLGELKAEFVQDTEIERFEV